MRRPARTIVTLSYALFPKGPALRRSVVQRATCEPMSFT